MFVVVQVINTKKQNRYGYSKGLVTYQNTFTDMYGVTRTSNSYGYSTERFERPIRKAYKVSIQESHRVEGKVVKKQKVLFTVNYYDLIDIDLCDYMDKKVESIAAEFNITTDRIYSLVETKLEPLIKEITKEFEQTEEYITHEKNERITDKYAVAKALFAQRYGVDSHEYDYCYNVYGELTSKEYLDDIIKRYNQRKSSYQDNRHSNYNNYYNYNSSYQNNLNGNHNKSYTEEEREKLKKFYKVLAKAFHPDLNRERDTTIEMQLINKLKEEWRI